MILNVSFLISRLECQRLVLMENMQLLESKPVHFNDLHINFKSIIIGSCFKYSKFGYKNSEVIPPAHESKGSLV